MVHMVLLATYTSDKKDDSFILCVFRNKNDLKKKNLQIFSNAKKKFITILGTMLPLSSDYASAIYVLASSVYIYLFEIITRKT